MADEFICPYYNKPVDPDECYDMWLVASRFFKDDDLVKEEDRDKLAEKCSECRKFAE